jgi:hypothetical protein
MSENHKKLPDWIGEFVPKELVQSTLFRFNIELQTVRAFTCKSCGHRHSTKVDDCEKCGSSSITREHKKVKIDLLPDLDLDYDKLEILMQEIPAQYAFYSMVYSEARLKVAIEERRLKATKGALIEGVQRRAFNEKIKLTAEQVKAVVEAEPDLQEADHKLNLAQMQCGKLYHMIEALKMKAELARSLAGFKRQEQEKS